MKRSLLVLASIAALLLLLAAPAQVSAASSQPRPFATLPYGDMGSFAESMTAIVGGDMYASLTLWGDSNTGQIWKINPSGATTLVASMNLGPTGALMGITHDSFGRLYVADADFGGTADSFIYQVGRDGSIRPVAELPPGSWPNGLACHGSYLYASDSSFGAIWRIRLGGSAVAPSAPWYQGDLLAPGDPNTDPSALGIGANGIAFRCGCLYAVVSDFGRIVRIPISAQGKPGIPTVVCERPELRTADGVAFDLLGSLWVVTNEGPTADQASGALFRVSPSGLVRQIAVNPRRLDYPTQPVFGTTRATLTTLFVENGAFSGDTAPSVVALNVGVLGQLVP